LQKKSSGIDRCSGKCTKLKCIIFPKQRMGLQLKVLV
jgi:hypothetical protein